MSSNVVKGTFIRFTGENTRVIDSQELVKKRMDDYSGVLRERAEAIDYESTYDETADGDDAVSALTSDEGDEGFKEISFGSIAEHIDVSNDYEEIPESTGEIRLDADEVRRECQEMIDKANRKADEIRQAAKEEAAQIYEDAKAQGYQEGIESGRNDGLMEYNNKIQELEAEKEAIYNQYNELLLELEPKMVDTLISVYEHVFGNSLYSRRDVLLCLLNRALSSANGDGSITVYVSSADYEDVAAGQDDLIARTALREVPAIMVREDLEPGDAKIETPYGIIDCGIDTEFEELKKALLMLSHERRG